MAMDYDKWEGCLTSDYQNKKRKEEVKIVGWNSSTSYELAFLLRQKRHRLHDTIIIIHWTRDLFSICLFFGNEK